MKRLTHQQSRRLDRVATLVGVHGWVLSRACHRAGIRYATAIRGLGLPTEPGATIHTDALNQAIARRLAEIARRQPESSTS